MPADIGGKSPLRDGSNEESILAEIKQISSLLQFKTCAPALMAVARIRHGVVVTADARENRPKMKFDNNRVFEYAISFPDGL
jgi:hypothetical protein